MIMRKGFYLWGVLCLLMVACASPEKALDTANQSGSDSLTVEKTDSIKKKDVRGEQLFAPKGATAAPKSKKENL